MPPFECAPIIKWRQKMTTTNDKHNINKLIEIMDVSTTTIIIKKQQQQHKHT